MKYRIILISTLCLLIFSCTKEKVCYECKIYDNTLHLISKVDFCNVDSEKINVLDSNGVPLPVVCQMK